MALFRRQLLSATRFRTSAVILPKARPSWHALQTRSYSSSHDEEPGDDADDLRGDIPWAIGAIAVTVPSVWYIYSTEIERQAKRDAEGGAHGHGHGHGKKKKDDEEEEETSESSDDEKEEKSEGDDNEEKEEKSDDQEEKSENKSESNDEEKDAKRQAKGQDSKGVDTTRGNKPTQDDPEIDDSDPKNRIVKYESAKGGLTVRKESKAAVNLGHSDDDDTSTTKSSGPAKNKQAKDAENVYNTDTKHSTPIDKSSEKSTKPGGEPETAKLKGPNDPRTEEQKQEDKEKGL